MSSPSAPPPFSAFPMQRLRQMKERRQPIAMVSLYDAPTATLCCDAEVDVLLVGDSLGNVVLGYDDTASVTLDDMTSHTAAVARGVRRSTRPQTPVVADLPFGTYHGSRDAIIANAVALLRCGAQALKLEGATQSTLDAVRLLTEIGAPVWGHIGFTPQTAALFSNIVQGRGNDEAQQLLDQARALQAAGAAAVVLEAMPAEVAQVITRALQIPTVGIGAGAGCDGQVLVWHDLVGITPRPPRFVRRFAQARTVMESAASDFVSAVHERSFPASEHTYAMPDEERQHWQHLTDGVSG